MNSPSLASLVFVGREAELAELVQAAQAADNGDPQSLLVRGEAGVGKTWLVEELLRTLGPDCAIAAVGGCIEVGGDGIPFAPFAEALRTLWQRLPEEIRARCTVATSTRRCTWSTARSEASRQTIRATRFARRGSGCSVRGSWRD